jgi:hypothetical protein
MAGTPAGGILKRNAIPSLVIVIKEGPMKPLVRPLVLAWIGCCLLAAGASASTAAETWTTTKALPGVPCSVTARLAVGYGAGSMTYRGGVSCAGAVGQKTLDVVPQVFRIVNGHRLWFNLSLVGRYQGPTPINPLRLSASTRAVQGHIYRLLVYARVTLANGHASSLTACAGCAGAPESSSPSTLSIRPQGNNPVEPDTTKQMRGTPCFVYQGGLDFTGVNGTYVVNYNGYAACRGQQLPAHPSLTLCVQVSGRVNGKSVWFTVNGSCMSAASATSDTVVLSTARTAFIGHGYRIMASATVHYPSASGTITSSATAYSSSAGP